MELSDVRRHHLSVVLEHLVNNGPRSRAALAHDTGLTKATVSSLVAELVERGLVESLETPRHGAVGRPATPVAAAARRVGGLGLMIEVDEVAACVVDLAGERRILHRLPGVNRDMSASEVVGRLRRVTRAALDEAVELDIHIAGCTLALPGLVDPETSTLRVAPNLHWFDADVRAIARRLPLPDDCELQIDNDSNLAALAELRSGAGREFGSFVVVSANRGVGAGIVLDGRVHRGAHGFGGELGHVVVDPRGSLCACGARGCLETVVGSGRNSSPAQVVDALAAALRTVVHLVDPEAVILGGTLAALDDETVAGLEARLADTTLGARWHPCQVRRAVLGPDATLVGAALSALDPVLGDPTTVALPEAQTA